MAKTKERKGVPKPIKSKPGFEETEHTVKVGDEEYTFCIQSLIGFSSKRVEMRSEIVSNKLIDPFNPSIIYRRVEKNTFIQIRRKNPTFSSHRQSRKETRGKSYGN
jgi:hypothetical protein